MTAVSAYRVGGEICQALGLDPNTVTSLTLDFRRGEVVVSVVHIHVQTDQIEPIKQVLTKYTLVPKEPA